MKKNGTSPQRKPSRKSETRITADVSRQELYAALNEVRSRCTPQTSQLVQAVFAGFDDLALELDEHIVVAHANGPAGEGYCLVRSFD